MTPTAPLKDGKQITRSSDYFPMCNGAPIQTDNAKEKRPVQTDRRVGGAFVGIEPNG